MVALFLLPRLFRFIKDRGRLTFERGMLIATIISLKLCLFVFCVNIATIASTGSVFLAGSVVVFTFNCFLLFDQTEDQNTGRLLSPGFYVHQFVYFDAIVIAIKRGFSVRSFHTIIDIAILILGIFSFYFSFFILAYRKHLREEREQQQQQQRPVTSSAAAESSDPLLMVFRNSGPAANYGLTEPTCRLVMPPQLSPMLPSSRTNHGGSGPVELGAAADDLAAVHHDGRRHQRDEEHDEATVLASDCGHSSSGGMAAVASSTRGRNNNSVD